MLLAGVKPGLEPRAELQPSPIVLCCLPAALWPHLLYGLGACVWSQWARPQMSTRPGTSSFRAGITCLDHQALFDAWQGARHRAGTHAINYW